MFNTLEELREIARPAQTFGGLSGALNLDILFRNSVFELYWEGSSGEQSNQDSGNTKTAGTGRKTDRIVEQRLFPIPQRGHRWKHQMK